MKRLIISETILAAKHNRRSSRAKNKKSSRDITDNMIRCRSSNVWGYNIDIRDDADTGTVYIQFKDKYGGPGDIYRYYDVPIYIYRKFIAGQSKGHNFWKYLRNKFAYSKLTGDKIGKLPNAVN